MSLVGPRPERPAFVHTFGQQIPFYGVRHSVRPGDHRLGANQLRIYGLARRHQTQTGIRFILREKPEPFFGFSDYVADITHRALATRSALRSG